MKTILQHVGEKKLIGLTVRTNNATELQPKLSKINALIASYIEQDIASQIPNRVKPGVTIAAYTDYESDEGGDYTYFFGEEVSCFEDVPKGCSMLKIPEGNYLKMPLGSGELPQMVIDAWSDIWKTPAHTLGAERTFNVDFEVYDDRSKDHANAYVDLFLGVEPLEDSE